MSLRPVNYYSSHFFVFFWTVLGTDTRASHMIGKCSTTELRPYVPRTVGSWKRDRQHYKSRKLSKLRMASPQLKIYSKKIVQIAKYSIYEKENHCIAGFIAKGEGEDMLIVPHIATMPHF